MLGCQTDVTHHRHAALHDVADVGLEAVDALELDRVGACAQQAFDGAHERLAAVAVRKEGQVGDHESVLSEAATDRGHMQGHHVEVGGDRVAVAVDGHGDGVADQHPIDAGGGDEARGERVVAGDEGDLVAAALGGGELRERGHHQVPVLRIKSEVKATPTMPGVQRRRRTRTEEPPEALLSRNEPSAPGVMVTSSPTRRLKRVPVGTCIHT